MFQAASCSRRQTAGGETGSVVSSQAVGRGSAGSIGGAGGRVEMEPGLELGFLCFPPCCRGCPFPSPSCLGADVLLVSALAAPSAHPGLLRSQSLVPSSSSSSSFSPRLGPVSLGMAVESSAHSACLSCNPPSFLPPAGLFVGKFKADECWGALGLRARR